ncbi:hypothetical protein [Streptomyces fructofermentans]|uniref:hypothetical protein n=1 Tax=Streptomyces fructofermentans TaxID=152141 RepID=UPI0037A8F1FC
MTSTTGTAGHPDVAEIADLGEGLLPPTRTADVRRHLEDCVLCTDVYESLEEIRGTLGTLPGPPRMPDDVAGRIDAALAAEALLHATAANVSHPEADADADSTEGDTTGVPATVGSPGTASGARSATHVSRETSTAVDRPAGRPRATTGPGRANRTPRGRRRTAVLGAVFTAAALGIGSLLLQTLGSDGSGKDTSSPSTEQSDTANTLAEEKLEARVADLLADVEKKKENGGPRSSNPQSEGSEAPSILNSPAVPVPECVRQGIGRDGEALAAEEGVYDGTPAYLVVLPDATDATRVNAYVVDSACVDKRSITAGKVLLQQSYPRN